MLEIVRRRLAALLLALGTVGAALVGACGEKKGALMLSINTDMKAPKDVSAVSVTISTNGAIKHSFIGRVTPEGDVLLPATLAIVEPEDKGTSIRIRVMAFQDRKPRVLRDVRTTVPSDGRTALLRIPLNFASDASAVGEPLPEGLVSGGGLTAAEFDFFGAFQPPCADIQNETIIDGECKDNFVDSATLPDFDQRALGDSTDQGSCFDVGKCFAGAAEVSASTTELDRTTCILQVNTAQAPRLNLAIVTPDVGECLSPGECYIPIDRGPAGWTESQGGVKLPSVVCRLLEGKKLRLATSAGTCAAKEEANPICRATSGGSQTNALCTEFKVGAPVDGSIGGSATSQVAVQATADYAASASAAVEGVTGSCRKIAQDLAASKADQDAAEANTDKHAKMNAWCALAVSAIGTTKAAAGGTLNVQVEPPVCRTSVSAKATCQGRCAANVCDLKANPLQCTGGSLVVECKGGCTASGGATVACEGACTGECRGSCTATGGVECAGKCSGACTASGAGTGPQPDGTCKGTCTGTCAATAPGAQCTGACDGDCTASCNGTAEVPVRCDGACSGDFVPLYCEGGRLEGGCRVDARCDASCDVSGAASAECPAPTVTVASAGTSDMTAAGKLRSTLEANLGALLALQARLEGMSRFSATLSGNGAALNDIKAACIPVVVAATNDALGDVTASLSASTLVTGAVGR